MNDSVIKIIKEKFDSLPESIQKIILSSEYEEILTEIGNQSQLSAEQIAVLERETTLVMMGLTPIKDLEIRLVRELNIDKIKGEEITKDINEKIFLKILELLEIMNTPAEEKPDWQQNLDFVLSGGDYSAFVNPPLLAKEGAGGGNSKEEPPRPSGTPPQKGGEGEIPQKITDIKSKFTI
jgi:hypothetical protein